jgi:hypothetical protein
MTKSLLIVAAALLVAPAAWAQQGSTGANSVGVGISQPVAPPPSAGGTPGASAQVQNSGPSGSTGSNNVGAAITPPNTPAPSTAAGATQRGRNQ